MANVDPLELEKFSALAHRWWDPEGEFRPLHDINPLRLEWIASHATLDGAAVLDVGCGGGILAEAMARKGARVTGIDLSDKALRVAGLHLRESRLGVRYEKAAVEDFHGEFDVVTCMELLEHVPDPARMVAACARLARPGGNITGLSQIAPEMAGKRLELLKEIVPKLVRVAVLWRPDGMASSLAWKESQLPARALSLQLHSMEVRSPNEFHKAFEDATRARAGALAVMPDSLFAGNLRRIADLAARSRPAGKLMD